MRHLRPNFTIPFHTLSMVGTATFATLIASTSFTHAAKASWL